MMFNINDQLVQQTHGKLQPHFKVYMIVNVRYIETETLGKSVFFNCLILVNFLYVSDHPVSCPANSENEKVIINSS